ncbi:MAG: restriction endonuclease subunit S [Treponema sp.]|nr:restriction endonuclease subunit S [Treponema sp.]
MYRTLISQSLYYYCLAEWLLLQELLSDYWARFAAISCSVKSFSDFQQTGRLDAEYYQPKYDELEQRLSAHECKPLGDIVSIKKSVEPGSDCYQENGILFVRVSDVSKFGISQTDLHLSPQEFSLEALRPHKDTILLSKDGSIGIAYKCETDLDVITSGALLHLNIVDSAFLPDYVTLVLNSIVVHLQAERDSNGAIIQHWKPDDIKHVAIPILALETQRAIAEKIQRSFSLRTESKRLLEQAKAMVEAEIDG